MENKIENSVIYVTPITASRLVRNRDGSISFPCGKDKPTHKCLIPIKVTLEICDPLVVRCEITGGKQYERN